MITVGRFSVADVTDIGWRGDVVQLTVDITPEDTGGVFAAAQALRQQVLGLVNDDEPVVPVTWTDDDNLDGYYQVVSAQAQPVQNYINEGIMRCQLSLRRVSGGFAAAEFEMVTGALLRTNGQSITAPQTILYARPLNDTSDPFSRGPDIAQATNVAETTRETPDGDMRVEFCDAPLDPTTFRWWPEPADAYRGGCLVEVFVGSTWYPIIGRQTVPVTDTTRWRISNGCVRLTSFTGSTSGTIEVFDTSAWDSFDVEHISWDGVSSLVTFPIGGRSTGLRIAPTAVLRNSPERVVIQSAISRLRMTYSITRGARHVEASWAQQDDVPDFAYGMDINAASTAITGGIRATSASASGNYTVAAVAAADTTDLALGRVYPTSTVQTGSMMVGVATNNTGGDPDSAPQLVEQFLGVSPVRQLIVAR